MADPRLSVVITGEAGGLSAALNQAKSQIQGFAGQASSALAGLQTAFAGLAAAVGGGAFLKNAVETAVDWNVQAQKMSKILGVTTEEASALAVAVGDVYGDVDTFLNLISKLTKTVAGNEEAFAKLGVQTRDANGNYRRTVDIFLDTASALDAIPAGMQRNIAAQTVFGKGWMEIEKYLALTRDRMGEAKEKTEELGLTVDAQGVESTERYRAAMNDLEDQVLGVKKAIGDQLVPVITRLLNTDVGNESKGLGALSKVLKVISTLLVYSISYAETFASAMLTAVEVPGRALAGAWKANTEMLRGNTGGAVQALKEGFDGAVKAWPGFAKKLKEQMEEDRKSLRSIWGLGGGGSGETMDGPPAPTDPPPGGAAAPARRTPFEPEKLKDQLQLLPELTNAFAGLEEANQRVQEEMADTGMSLERLAAQGRADAAGGFAAGLSSYLEQARNGFEQFRNLALDVIYSVEYAFSDGLTRIAMGQVSLTEGLKGMWQGLSQSVVGGLMRIITTKGMEWALDKAKFTWDKMKAAWESARTIKEVAESGTRSAAAGTATAANTAEAASGIFKAHSGFPWVGVAVALGMIALMMTTMKKITARAVGGLVTKPEFTLLGEAGPELVAPESSFKDWAADLTANIMASQAQAQAYQLQAGRYGQRMGEMPPQMAQAPIQISMAGAQFIGQDRRSLEQFGSLALDGILVAARARGVVLRPGLVGGGV